ncbi:MAG: hypothetical protein V4592_26345 [Bacteroidota bacterium]
MSYEIQAGVECENCIKCGKRPVIDQHKKGGWEIKCANDACKNSVSAPLVDFETWNRINKKNINLTTSDNKFMRSA